MTIAVLGATGRLGRTLARLWSPDVARFFGRSAPTGTLAGCDVLIDLRGIVPGAGDVFDNLSIAKQALDLGQAIGARRVFLPSSAAVYGRLTGPLDETRAAPVSDYGHAKRAVETMAAAHPQPATCLRIGNVAGADALLGGWTPGFRLDQWPDGQTPLRSYIGPRAFARVLQDLAMAPDLPDLLNVAAPEAVTMGDLLDAAGLQWTPRPAPDTAIRRVALDLSRLMRHGRFAPHDSTAAGIVADWQSLKESS